MINKCGMFVGAMSKPPPLAWISQGGGVSFWQELTVVHGARFAVAQGHPRSPITGSLESPLRIGRQ